MVCGFGAKAQSRRISARNVGHGSTKMAKL
jgi:hypothetical protein